MLNIMNRRALLSVAALGLGAAAVAVMVLTLGTSGKASSGPRLSVQDSYDFGRISAAQQVVKEVVVTNAGTEVLVIKDVLPVPPPEGG